MTQGMAKCAGRNCSLRHGTRRHIHHSLLLELTGMWLAPNFFVYKSCDMNSSKLTKYQPVLERDARFGMHMSSLNFVGGVSVWVLSKCFQDSHSLGMRISRLTMRFSIVPTQMLVFSRSPCSDHYHYDDPCVKGGSYGIDWACAAHFPYLQCS